MCVCLCGSPQCEEGILLYLLVFCFRYDSVGMFICPSVYTVMTLANCRAVNRSVLKLKDGKNQRFSHAER